MTLNQQTYMKWQLDLNVRSGAWEVKRYNIVIKTFSDYDAASDHIQACVENDAWHASNRD